MRDARPARLASALGRTSAISGSVAIRPALVTNWPASSQTSALIRRRRASACLPGSGRLCCARRLRPLPTTPLLFAQLLEMFLRLSLAPKRSSHLSGPCSLGADNSFRSNSPGSLRHRAVAEHPDQRAIADAVPARDVQQLQQTRIQQPEGRCRTDQVRRGQCREFPLRSTARLGVRPLAVPNASRPRNRTDRVRRFRGLRFVHNTVCPVATFGVVQFGIRTGCRVA